MIITHLLQFVKLLLLLQQLYVTFCLRGVANACLEWHTISYQSNGTKVFPNLWSRARLVYGWNKSVDFCSFPEEKIRRETRLASAKTSSPFIIEASVQKVSHVKKSGPIYFEASLQNCLSVWLQLDKKFASLKILNPRLCQDL